MRILMLFCSALLFTLASCAPESEKVEKSKRIQVYATILPVAHIARLIGGDKVSSKSIIGKGQTPHSFAATISDIKLVHKAKMFFSIALPLEVRKINKIFSESTVRAIDVSMGVRRIAIVEHHHEHEGHEHHQEDQKRKDPHIWLSVQNCVLIARNICSALVEYDASNAAYYKANLKKYEREAKKLDMNNKKLLAPYKGRSFFVYHPAFGYFAHEYQLKQCPIEFSGRTPSAKELKELIAEARKEKAKIILIQPQFSEKHARFAARAVGARVMRVDPLAADALNTIKKMAQAVAGAFSR